MTTSTIIQIAKEDFDHLIQRVAGDVLLTRESAAKLIDCSPDTIDALVKAGKLTPYYDTRDNVSRRMVRYSRNELLYKVFSKVRTL